jgi:putative transposase
VPTAGWARPGSGGGKVGKNPPDRGKNGTKTSLLVEGQGGPLGVVIDGANIPDSQLLQATIEAVVVERPEPTPKAPQHLCLDKGFDNPTGHQAATSGGHTPPIRRIGEENKPCAAGQGHKPRRWVVERTIAWLFKCRALLVRYDKHGQNDLGLLQLACGLLWFRRLHRLRAA